MEQKIVIPQPCHENWETMLPEEQGRYCNSCCKTVIDFSSWETQDILAFIENKNGERVCGRFKNEQLTSATDSDVRHIWLKEIAFAPISFLKKVAAIVIVCFGLLHSNTTNAQTGGWTQGKTKLDTTKRILLGRPTIKKNDTIKKKPECTVSPQATVGIVALPPLNTSKTGKNQPDKKQNLPVKKENN